MFLTQDFSTADLVTLKLVTWVCVSWVDDLRLRSKHGSTNPQTRQSGLHSSSDPVVWVLAHPYFYKVLLESNHYLISLILFLCVLSSILILEPLMLPPLSHFILTWSVCFFSTFKCVFLLTSSSNSDLTVTNLPLIPFSFLDVKHQNLEF